MSKHAIATQAAAAFAAFVLIASPVAHASEPLPSLPQSSNVAAAAPSLTPYSAGDGTYRFALHVQYPHSVSGRLELRHHQYFVDDNLKATWQQTTVIWSVKWRF